MYHYYRKDSVFLRTAMFYAYERKCVYCGLALQPRGMHIDHILPTSMRETSDRETLEYIQELEKSGFIRDSIENYVPTCSACNLQKNNRVFSASNLRFYHEMARSRCDRVLLEINKLKSAEEETYYEPVDATQWETLDFKYQRSLLHAIMGYRLSPADVEACPRFPQVERLKKQLSLVDYVMLQGEPGCGKSISIYQAAYDYLYQGWHVYRFCGTETATSLSLPQNTELSLYIIDDAQLFSDAALRFVVDQARPNRKILLAKTISSAVGQDTILLTNQEALKILSDFYLQNKNQISTFVHQCDKDIGVSFWSTPVEHRIQYAKKAATPWLFNYVLRGGWQTIREQYDAICQRNQCGLLAALVALLQVGQFDHSINFDWLCRWAYEYDHRLVWTQQDLSYLVDRRIVLSEEDVRIVHIQSANIIIAQFLNSAIQDNLHLLREIIEQAYAEHIINPFGLVWICNGIRSYTNLVHYEKLFISEELIKNILEDISGIVTPRERRDIIYFMEKVFSYDATKNGYFFFLQHKRLICQWVMHADSETAYAYADLLNTLYNKDKLCHSGFADQIDWHQFFDSLNRETAPDMYSWGHLINRLTIAPNIQGRDVLSVLLKQYIAQTCSSIPYPKLVDYTAFLSMVAFFVSDTLPLTIRQMLPTYKKLFEVDMNKALEIFDFDFFYFICGMSLFGGHRATADEKETSKGLISVIPEHQFADTISNSLPRDWQHIHSILYWMAKYDGKKCRRIVRLVDIDKLAAWDDCWDQSHDVVHLCVSLSIGDPKVAQHYVEACKHIISTVYSPIVLCAPKCAIELHDEGVKVELNTNHWWDVSCAALTELIRIDANKAREIVTENIPILVKTINSISALDFENNCFIKFLEKLKEFDHPSFREITKQIDMSQIEMQWENASYNPKKKKQIYERYNSFCIMMKEQ